MVPDLPRDALAKGIVHAHRGPGPNGSDLLTHERRALVADVGQDPALRIAVCIDTREISPPRVGVAGDPQDADHIRLPMAATPKPGAEAPKPVHAHAPDAGTALLRLERLRVAPNGTPAINDVWPSVAKGKSPELAGGA